MKSPLVSIVMNCYNSDRFLKEAIDSIYAQTFSNWEVVFWDNASTDDSASIAQSYDERVKYYLAPETTPLGEARNLALQKVIGKYIAFLDCDDLFLPDKLQKQVQLMERSDYALCYGSAIIIDENGNEIKKTNVKNHSGYLFGEQLKRYEINMQSVVVRREILLDENLSFERKLKYSPDYDFFMEIVSRYSVGVIHDYIVKYRILDNSLSKKSLDIASSEIKFTLDRISEQMPGLRKKFVKEFDSAYKKLNYYDAVAAVYRDNRKQARKKLWPIINSRIEYLIFYILLLLPVSNYLVLKILGRER